MYKELIQLKSLKRDEECTLKECRGPWRGFLITDTRPKPKDLRVDARYNKYVQEGKVHLKST
jgi:hypothetical protein